GDAHLPQLVVVVEIQLGKDPAKQLSWPQYVVAMHQRWRCDVELLVIAPDPRVAAWARQPIRLSRRGSQIVPLVLGSEDFPRMAVEDLAGHPHATVFHALAHCRRREDLPLLEQALMDVRSLPESDRIGYYEILRSCLFPSFLELAEVAMSLEHTRFYQELVARLKAEGKAEGVAEGRAEGRAEGVAEGKAEGKAQGEELGRKAQLIRTISRQLGRRVALPGGEALAMMKALSLDALEQLAEDLLDFNRPEDLEAWLAGH
ncbi:MAG: DUF4351 domain-containing protein, partial [Candidatus Sericytochromatia bacterium]|nr:DUF4351 domain-containing protein [Candidatus Sericytochromatia bacterium]